MTDWIEHNGGPQPVGDDVFVEVQSWVFAHPAKRIEWSATRRYRIVNQHLIDAARLEGIRLGLESAMKIVWKDARWMGSDGPRIGEKLWLTLRNLDPETIAREAVLDQLTSEAQAQGMGYDKENDQ